MTQGGGWPLTVFLTPDLRPFYGGTYFPPDDRYGRPGFRRLLESLADAYQNQKEKIEENANYMTKSIAQLEQLPTDREAALPTLDALVNSAERLVRQVDLEYGGFGTAPKFPNTMALMFLWRVGIRKNFPELRNATVVSLEKMCRGGIFDQMGGGFSRYSVDTQWAVPHFEKMLYDNALLLKSMAEVTLSNRHLDQKSVTPDQEALFIKTTEMTVDFLSREMLSPEGLFYSALDADSEGEEGKFYVWSYAEAKARLDEREFAVWRRCYGVTEIGNFEHETNVLALQQTLEDVANWLGFSLEEATAALNSANSKLMELRAKRVRPGLDDKVLTAWNALMISGLVGSGAALSGRMREKCWAMARGAYAALLERAQNQGRLYSTVQKGQGRFAGYLDDYAFMAKAALDMARISKSAEETSARIQESHQWIRVILDQFKDSDGVGYFFTSADHEKLLQRPKTLFDQAIPSGTSVALEVMMALAEILEPEQAQPLRDEVEKQMTRLFPLIQNEPFGFAELLNSANMFVEGPIVLSGKKSDEALFVHPFVFQGKSSAEDGVLICHMQSCSLPISGDEKIIADLKNRLVV